MMVNTSRAMAADDRTRPGMSTAAACGSLQVGAASATRTGATAATGTMASPASSMPLRPSRSDRLPKVSSSAAKTRL